MRASSYFSFFSLLFLRSGDSSRKRGKESKNGKEEKRHPRMGRKYRSFDVKRGESCSKHGGMEGWNGRGTLSLALSSIQSSLCVVENSETEEEVKTNEGLSKLRGDFYPTIDFVSTNCMQLDDSHENMEIYSFHPSLPSSSTVRRECMDAYCCRFLTRFHSLLPLDSFNDHHKSLHQLLSRRASEEVSRHN